MNRTRMPRDVQAIQRELDHIRTQDAYGFGLVRHQRVSTMLEREANRHSVALEYSATESRTAAFREALNRQSKAWDYAIKKVCSAGRYGALELAVIAKILVPGQPLHPVTGFRMDEVHISGGAHSPPSPARLPEEMNSFFERLARLDSPLERAIFSHYHLARIHPFVDGNGRTARVIQNAILCAAHYVPISVSTGDRDVYLNALEASDRAYQEHDEHYLFPIAQFLTDRFAESVRSYRLAIPKARRAPGGETNEYRVQVSGVRSPADWIAISRQLKDFARSNGTAVSVCHEKAPHAARLEYLNVRGHIRLPQLDRVLSTIAEQRGLSYDIIQEA